MGTGEIEAASGAGKACDRLAVQVLRLRALAEQGARAGLETESPVGAADRGSLGEPAQCIGGHVLRAGACARLDQLGQRPGRPCDRFGILEGSATVAEGIVISAEPVVQDQARELHDDRAEPAGLRRQVAFASTISRRASASRPR